MVPVHNGRLVLAFLEPGLGKANERKPFSELVCLKPNVFRVFDFIICDGYFKNSSEEKNFVHLISILFYVLQCFTWLFVC